MRWEIQFTHPIYLSPQIRQNQERMLARVFFWTAQLHHEKGQDAQALNDIADMLLLARAAYHEMPGTMTYFQGASIDTEAIYVMNEIGLALQVGGEHAEPGTMAASRDQINALIAQLLDNRDALHG